MDYGKTDLLTAGSLYTGTSVMESTLNLLRNHLSGMMTTDSESMRILRTKLDEAIAAAEEARVDAHTHYHELLNKASKGVG